VVGGGTGPYEDPDPSSPTSLRALKGPPAGTDLTRVNPFTLPRRRALISRVFAAALLSVVAALPLMAPTASGQPSLDDLKRKKETLQQDLERSLARVEQLMVRHRVVLFEISAIDEEIRNLQEGRAELQARVVAAANRLYRAPESAALEVLLSARSFSDLQSRAEALDRLSAADAETFEEFGLREAQLAGLQESLIEKSEELAATRGRLDHEREVLQARFKLTDKRYRELKHKLAVAARRAAKNKFGKVVISADGMTCPIAAPHSFIDSWGFPRSGGRTHEGTDMMADMGAPVVAITDGTITYSGVGSLSGNWLILTGDDGHDYMYMHNRENLITSGRVKVGEQIATVGDTGNAQGGAPHVHFEYHPNGGGPVNPYPLLMEVCTGGT
jgi:murein DD-endopeptidase MepM/ murein hydrolase activator NlpD